MRRHTAEELHAIKLRVNRNLLEEIRKLAAREHRSVNNWMTATLTSLIQQDARAAKRQK